MTTTQNTPVPHFPTVADGVEIVRRNEAIIAKINDAAPLFLLAKDIRSGELIIIHGYVRNEVLPFATQFRVIEAFENENKSEKFLSGQYIRTI